VTSISQNDLKNKTCTKSVLLCMERIGHKGFGITEFSLTCQKTEPLRHRFAYVSHSMYFYKMGMIARLA
jgi:hypothetical protein